MIDLFEMKATALYHATSFFNAVHIIAEDMFRDKTEHTLPELGPEPVTGISFTRNVRFAFDWSFVTFELDRSRLAQRYRLYPVNYWRSVEKSRSEARDEAEEFVVGPVAPASRYITAIHISAKRLHDLATLHGPRQRFYDPLREHPLLKVHSP